MLTGYAELSKLKLSIILKYSPARLPVRSCPASLTVQTETEVRSQCFDLDNLIDQQFVRPFFFHSNFFASTFFVRCFRCGGQKGVTTVGAEGNKTKTAQLALAWLWVSEV